MWLKVTLPFRRKPYTMNQQPDAKRMKNDQGQALAEKSKQSTARMIELDICSSDEEFWMIMIVFV